MAKSKRAYVIVGIVVALSAVVILAAIYLPPKEQASGQYIAQSIFSL